LAAADRPEADRRRWPEGIAARHDAAHRRKAAGHVQRTPALLLRPGQEGRRRERARLRPLRGSLVGRLGVGREHQGEALMEFLVEFEIEVPEGTPEREVEQRESAEAAAAAKLVDDGHLL